MVYNQWYVILESKELKKHKPLRVIRLNENSIMGDKPIIDYRKHRQALIDAGTLNLQSSSV